MDKPSFSGCIGLACLCIMLFSEQSIASIQLIRLEPGFSGSQIEWIDNKGLFLLSNNSDFAFGFQNLPADNPSLFALVVIHKESSTIVWSANRHLVTNTDKFVFVSNGTAYLEFENHVIWYTRTSHKGVVAMELWNSGNLVLLDKDSQPIWQSFDYPTDTLLSGQDFVEGMILSSNRNARDLSYFLKIESGDMVLYVNFSTPQPYWSIKKERQIIYNKRNGVLHSAKLSASSWDFYDKEHSKLWSLNLPSSFSPNATRATVLDSKGIMSFTTLLAGSSPSDMKIPKDLCYTPQPCGDSYSLCLNENQCQCPQALDRQYCEQGILSPCSMKNSAVLLQLEDGLTYAPVHYVLPFSKTNLVSCKDSCLKNCSCIALFFEKNSGNCFLFDEIGNLKQETGYDSFIKVRGTEGKGGKPTLKHVLIAIFISLGTFFVILAMLYAYYQHHHKTNVPTPPDTPSDEDNFLKNISTMPVRISYEQLQEATKNFSVKLGNGGFGSVYHGILPDGSEIAVKKLEGIGQGGKEFRAEVSTIGSIHHIHLVKLRGFCAQGTHRLLAYEYMENGSLDRWIFKDDKEGFVLDWDKRYNIALSTAKGLAYLHELCEVKIIHCDIKPENVLLDENYNAKVSDFGLAKLMNREQSQVFTTLRGTRGYLAPEWISNYAISEKSDVYSYGMLLLEIIGGRKNYDSTEASERVHFPSYAYRRMEEGKWRDILDMRLNLDRHDERVPIAIKVALCCIQEDMSLRPSMSKVVQMLEGLCDVPPLPDLSQLGFRLNLNSSKSTSDETYSGLSDSNSHFYLSSSQLSGPR